MDKAQLLPCPFCGGEPRQYDRVNSSTVTCMSCNAKVTQSEMGMGDAPARWNRRNQPMVDEYLRWLDFYHAGNGNFCDFLKQEINHG